jgi:hypothetical protein
MSFSFQSLLFSCFNYADVLCIERLEATPRSKPGAIDGEINKRITAFFAVLFQIYDKILCRICILRLSNDECIGSRKHIGLVGGEGQSHVSINNPYFSTSFIDQNIDLFRLSCSAGKPLVEGSNTDSS